MRNATTVLRRLACCLVAGFVAARGVDVAVAAQEDCTTDDALVFISAEAQYPDGRTERLSSGSGFLIHETGYVLTSRHVAYPEDAPADA